MLAAEAHPIVPGGVVIVVGTSGGAVGVWEAGGKLQPHHVGTHHLPGQPQVRTCTPDICASVSLKMTGLCTFRTAWTLHLFPAKGCAVYLICHVVGPCGSLNISCRDQKWLIARWTPIDVPCLHAGISCGFQPGRQPCVSLHTRFLGPNCTGVPAACWSLRCEQCAPCKLRGANLSIWTPHVPLLPAHRLALDDRSQSVLPAA